MEKKADTSEYCRELKYIYKHNDEQAVGNPRPFYNHVMGIGTGNAKSPPPIFVSFLSG